MNVLDVMDLARESLRNSAQKTPDGLAIHSAVAQARAAVAELIESGNRVVRAFETLGRAEGVVDNIRAHHECASAMVAHKSALTRVGG